jgi:hypothetical protein
MPVAETSKTTLLLGSYSLTGGTWRQIYPVVEAVGMCEIAAAISKGSGKGGKTVLSLSHAFHGPAFPRSVVVQFEN